MKRLISARDVLAAMEKHEDLKVDGNTIVTAQAEDIARENGVVLLRGPETNEFLSTKAVAKEPLSSEGGDTLGQNIVSKQPSESIPLSVMNEKEPLFTADQIEHVVSAAVDKGLWTKNDLQNLLHSEQDLPPITVGVSGRHIHLSKEHLCELFGEGYKLTPIKDLSQPGQFASKECVTLIGPKGVIEKVRVLGPVRSQTQVEVLAGDTFKLGIPLAIRLSGHLNDTPGITLCGPKGTVVLSEGVIVAARHIHMTPEDANRRELHDGQVVSIKFGGIRGGRLDNVVIRANESGALDCHIDTEEANALHIKNGSIIEIIK